MQSVHRLLGRASLWVHFRMWLNAAVVSVSLAVAGIVALRICERLLGIPVEWGAAWVSALATALVSSVAWVLLHRRSRLEVARVIDDVGALKETLSTALCVQNSDDPWSRAAVAQAERAAGGVRLRGILPVHVRRWWAPLLLAALFLVAGLTPQLDLLGFIKKAQAADAERVQLDEARADAQSAEQEIRRALTGIDDAAVRELTESGPEPASPQPRTPLEIRLDAIKKLTSANDRLNSLRESDKALAMEALRKKMAELRQPRGEELSEFASALQKGDFAEARKQLEQVAENLAKGDLSEEQKAALQEQLQSLSEQLKSLAQDQAELENALRQAGLDPSLASDPQALKDALEKMDGLSPEQKQQLQQMAEACQQAGAACQGMSGALSKAAGKLAAGDAGALGDLGGQLSAMEMMQQDLASLEAARRSIKNRLSELGSCLGRPGDMAMGSGGKGGPGGGNRPSASTPIDGASKVKVKSKTGEGPIIGSTLVQGDQVRGESAKEFSQAVRAGEASAAEAIESKRVPRELEDAVKKYFGRLEKEGAPAAKSDTAAPPPAPPKDAAPADEDSDQAD